VIFFTQIIQDFRSDFSRGHHVSSQRARIQKRNIQCRRDIDSFAPKLMGIFESLVPAEEEIAKQRKLINSLNNLISREWPHARLHLYGSCANSFGVSNSDIDVCMSIDDRDLGKAEIILRLAEILEAGNLQNVQVNHVFLLLYSFHLLACITCRCLVLLCYLSHLLINLVSFSSNVKCMTLENTGCKLYFLWPLQNI
jgi:predicted nucleotidyltransferase